MQKIMFNDSYGLTDAVLQGRKTMTRRLCKDSATGEVILAKDVDSVRFYPDNIAEFVMTNGDVRCSVPQYQIGEVVAIAQSYKDVREGGYPVDSRYDAFREADWGIGVNGALKGSAGETNKMFVKADLMPHRIRITDLKVERLQDISDLDCLREGIFEDAEEHGGLYTTPFYDFVGNDGDGFATPREAFAHLFDKVSGRGTWDRNPCCFCYEFKLVK